MKCYNQHKLEELCRRLGVFEEELRRSTERVNSSDKKVPIIK